MDKIQPGPPRLAKTRLNIAVVGAGMGGLAAAFCLGRSGHSVTVFERAAAITDIGAGIQVSPNVSRLLIRWGMGEELKRVAVQPSAISFRRYKDGERIGWSKVGEKMRRQYDAPYLNIHRSDYVRLILKLATPYMMLRLNTKVLNIDPSSATLHLASGESFSADLIIGADGARSMIRRIVTGEPDIAIASGDAAYRATVPTSEMLKDSELRHLVEETEMTGWVGPGRHIAAYCVSAKQQYNIVLVHPDRGSTESWTTRTDPELIRKEFADWEPRVQKLLKLVKTPLLSQIVDRAPLKSWIHPDGKIVLLGDAAHPMMPYRAQGAAMAIEDAAVLGSLLSHITHRRELQRILNLYQEIRHPRATLAQDDSRKNQTTFHYADGPEQERRDASMRAGMEAALKEEAAELVAPKADLQSGNANMWADKTKNDTQYSYDAEAEAEAWWSKFGGMLDAAPRL